MKQDETMMDLTRKNQIRAQAFRGTVQGRRIARIEFITPETLESNDKDVLYSTWLPGMKFEEYAKEYPSEAKELARIIATRWMNLAIFQGLLFHPDLHFGNFKVNVVSKDFVQVGLLDFGMLGELSPQTRDILAKLTLAKYWRNEKLIADYLWALSDERENMISKADLLAAITRHPEKFKLSEQEWVEWGLSQGLTVHREVTAFSRGLVTIGQLLETAGAKEDLEKIKVIVARQNLRETTRLIIQSTHDRFKGVPRSVEPDRPTPQVVKRMPAQAAGTLSCQALF
jgi:predicted unusual protein kinase regulating ubiquinone biosynthesis (AarF/ABC1/UbiB family)